MQIQANVERFLIVPEWFEQTFLDNFMNGYEIILTSKLPYDTVIPNLDDVFDYMGEFFYEVVSFHEYSGDTLAYCNLPSDEEKEYFYAIANEEYYGMYSADLKTLAESRHISVFDMDDEYINMPIKEVW